MGSAVTDGKAVAGVTILAARRWWGMLVECFLLLAIGSAFLLFLTSTDILALMALLALALLVSGICLLAMGLRRKEKDVRKRMLLAEGAIGILSFLAYWAINVSVADNSLENEYLGILFAAWAVGSAVTAVLWWRLLKQERPRGRMLLGATVLASMAAYLALALAFVFIGSEKMLKDYYADWRSGVILVSSLLVAIGLARVGFAVERVDPTHTSKWYGRRWAMGTVVALIGSFLMLLGTFAYTYTDLVYVQVEDGSMYMGFTSIGYVYRDVATGIIVVGVGVLLVGIVLLATGWKGRTSKIRTRTFAFIVFIVLLVQGFASMLIVNPSALDTGSNRWNMQPGDYLDISCSSTSTMQNRNLTSGELINITTWHFNFTESFTVEEVSGRSDIFLSMTMSSNDPGMPPYLLGNVTAYSKLTKDAQTFDILVPIADLDYLRDETLATPWGPRICQRYSIQEYSGNGGMYSYDAWVHEGITLVAISDYIHSDSYVEPKQWSFNHAVASITGTSLEEITDGPSGPIPTNPEAWVPMTGDYLNYTWSPGYGESASWDYLVIDVDPSSMLLNLTVRSAEEPSAVISTFESWYQTRGNTTMGVVLYPNESDLSYCVFLVGNEILATPWGPLECTHYFVTHPIDDSGSYSREDLWVRGGLLLKLESVGLSQYAMTLTGTNMVVA